MSKSATTSLIFTIIHILPLMLGMEITNITEAVPSKAPSGRDCSQNPCGTNAICSETYDRPLCLCPPGCSGSPYINCYRDECLDTTECPGYHVCRHGRCIDPCDGACAENATCFVRNESPVCSCLKGYNGDPLVRCRLIEIEEQCRPGSRCGTNTSCEVKPSGYFVRDVISRECDFDDDCSSSQMCQDNKCIPACKQCGRQALCLRVNNHRAVCECPEGYVGSPYRECRPECYRNADCSDERFECVYGTCKNRFDRGCGENSNCDPVCRFPLTYFRNPFLRCRSITKIDLCDPNPCGENTACVVEYNSVGRPRPVCTCLPGFTGNTLTGCVRCECSSNDECDDHRSCIGYACVHRWAFLS